MKKYVIPAVFALVSTPVFSLAGAEDPLMFQPDMNRNEVRDDVDGKIANLYNKDPNKVFLATSYARLLQQLAQSGTNLEYSRLLNLQMGVVDACWREYSSETLQSVVFPMVLTTYGVSKSYLRAVQTAHESLPAITTKEQLEYMKTNRETLCH